MIQRALSDAMKATTSATSSGLPSRFKACIPSVISRPGFRLCEVRHICVDYSRCDRVYAYPAWPENGGPVLHQNLECCLCRGVGKDRRVLQTGLAHDRAGHCGGDHDDAGALAENGQQLLYQEERASDVCCEEVIKVLYRVICDACGLADAGVGYEDIQSVADDGANLLGELCCTFGVPRSAEIASARPPLAWIAATSDSASCMDRP